jgi:BspA type Leucine rich repeat region (6 copies)
VIYAKKPLECQITSNGGVGTTCDFQNIRDVYKDTSRIIAYPTTYFGEVIDNNSVRSIRFDRSTFVNIPNVIFAKFSTVWSVKFGTGKIKEITKGNFKNAGELQQIEFFNSHITQIRSKGFEGSTSLREISFRQCKIGTIANDAFAGLPNLKRIRLSGSQFDTNQMLKAMPRSVEAVIMP